ncbi:hypothetical protein [Bradyrhizobium sp. SEMIA]|uniref:hypothetical protein n=1 Tax=Bradyrhizobium sp. SEMIA TaxID=2597515 RepID=UPI0018A491E2|nr:hypothetical protein [Bradyrhizobium sp. SEMIA]QOG20403.1 hypothetical protein FOM02_26700 [Bradyrhizobium sp. SEMIA]
MTEAQLLADIALISEIILEHGEKYAPYLDRLEAELEARRRNDPISRARAHLRAPHRRRPSWPPS